MSSFYSSIAQNFLIAFGVVIGASLFSGLGALLTNAPPLKVMTDVAGSRQGDVSSVFFADMGHFVLSSERKRRNSSLIVI